MKRKVTSGASPEDAFSGWFVGEIVTVGKADNRGQGMSVPIEWKIVAVVKSDDGEDHIGDHVTRLFGLRDDGSIPMGTDDKPGKYRALWEQHFGPLLPDQEIDEESLLGCRNEIKVIVNKRGYVQVTDFEAVKS